MTETEKDPHRIRRCGAVHFKSAETCNEEVVTCTGCGVRYLFGNVFQHVSFGNCDCTEGDRLLEPDDMLCGSCALDKFHFWHCYMDGTFAPYDMTCTLRPYDKYAIFGYVGYSKKIINPRTKSANKLN